MAGAESFDGTVDLLYERRTEIVGEVPVGYADGTAYGGRLFSGYGGESVLSGRG